MQYKWIVTEKQKLVQFIKNSLTKETYSLRKIKSFIDKGYCTVNKKRERFASVVVQKNDTISLCIPEELQTDTSFSTDRILYEDEYFFAYDKPVGMSCDEQGIVAQMRQNKRRCILVHRLDKVTSGVLLIAKSKDIEEYFLQQFQERKIRKEYIAIVDGIVKNQKGVVKNYLGPLKSGFGQVKWGKVSKNGSLAHTEYECICFGKKETLLRLYPYTGRTHQLRIHTSDLGHPILGDPLYGTHSKSSFEASRLMLHAEKITFLHPVTKEVMHISAPLPDEMKKAVVQLFKRDLYS